mgnify:CR=1 FL=1
MQTISINLTLPAGWHELDDEQLRYLFALIAEDFDSDAIKTLCLCRWSGLQVRHRHCADFSAGAERQVGYVCRHNGREFIVKAVQIAELLPALAWLDEMPSVPVCIRRIGRHRAFSPDFQGIAFEKFIVCDNLYQGFLATRSDDLLRDLASILYGKEKIRLTPAEATSVFYWFCSVKTYLANLFPHFFQAAPDNLLGSPSLPSGKQIQESVNAMLRALTKGDPIREADVLALDTHRALTELDAQAKEYQEFNAKFPKK